MILLISILSLERIILFINDIDLIYLVYKLKQ